MSISNEDEIPAGIGQHGSPTSSGIWEGEDVSILPQVDEERGEDARLSSDAMNYHSTLNSRDRLRDEVEPETPNNNGESFPDDVDDANRYLSPSLRRRRTVMEEPPIDLPPDHPLSLEERHERVNELFGFMPWKGHVGRRPLEERSQAVQSLYEKDQVKKKPGLRLRLITPGNLLWTVTIGWFISLSYIVVGGMLLTSVVGYEYAFHCFELARYFFFPFGKHLERVSAETFPEKGESRLLLSHKRRFTLDDYRSSFLRKIVRFLATLIWYLFAVPVLFIAHTIAFFVCWFSVFMIPMSKVNKEATKCLFKDPLRVGMRIGDPNIKGKIVLCTYNAVNRFYYKYSIGGMNVVLFNFIPFIIFVLIWGYAFPSSLPQPVYCPPLLMFVLCLVAIIPLAYYIGAAVSSISAQSTFAVGAILNATFGSLIELILYYLALRKGLSELVTSAVTGSLLGTMLLLPGLAMVGGGFKFKEQRFNAGAAGVSSVLLIVSIIGAFTPTVFYQVYAGSELNCETCNMQFLNFTGNATTRNLKDLDCKGCHYNEISNFDDDPAYIHHARPLQYTCACILPFAYAIGLLFTLKTHKFMWDEKYWKKDDEEHGGGHSGPEWSRIKCVAVLLVATVAFSMLAEKLVDSIEPTLAVIGLSEGFVGLTVVALVPNTAEFVNAIQFALQNNVALAVEIGSSAAVQISLIQIPVLVLLSVIINKLHSLNSFTLIFPTMDLFSVIFSVIILNYISVDGRSNYFEGAALCLIWLILVSASFWAP